MRKELLAFSLGCLGVVAFFTPALIIVLVVDGVCIAFGQPISMDWPAKVMVTAIVACVFAVIILVRNLGTEILRSSESCVGRGVDGPQ